MTSRNLTICTVFAFILAFSFVAHASMERLQMAPSKPLKVNSSTLLGDVQDARYNAGRDGGYSGVINGSSFWIFQDSPSTSIPEGKFIGFYTNSAARNSSHTNSTIIKDVTLNPWGGANQFIPHTSNEKLDNIDGGHRWALWPTAPAATTPGKGIIYFSRVLVNTSRKDSQFQTHGIGVAVVDTSKEPPLVTRPVETLFQKGNGSNNPLYGQLNSFSDGGYVYAYGLAFKGTALYVARASVANATNIAAYKYYNAKTTTWQDTVPDTTDNSAAILKGTLISSGTIYFSNYHNAYVFVYFNGYADSTFRAKTAPSPVGPWSGEVFLLSTPHKAGAYNYHGCAHPEYDTTGATLIVSASRPAADRIHMTAWKLTFA